MASMSAPELAPRSTVRGIVAVWVFGLLAAIAIVLFAPEATRPVWFALALAGSLLLAFAVQLGYGRSIGFIQRVGASALGAMLVLGLVSLVVAIAAVIPEA